MREIDRMLSQYEFKISVDYAIMPVALETEDISISYVYADSERSAKSKVSISGAVYGAHTGKLCNVNEPVKPQLIERFPRKTIACIVSDYKYSFLSLWNKAHPGNEFILKGYSDASDTDLIRAINRGDADGTLVFPTTFNILVKEPEITNLRLTPPAFIADTSFMLAKKETALRDDIDGAIKTLREDRTLSRLSNKYLGYDMFAAHAAQFEAQGTVQ